MVAKEIGSMDIVRLIVEKGRSSKQFDIEYTKVRLLLDENMYMNVL